MLKGSCKTIALFQFYPKKNYLHPIWFNIFQDQSLHQQDI